MRHSYTTAALAAGIPAKVVSERLGHANVSITLDTYSHVLPELDETAASTVAALILGDAVNLDDAVGVGDGSRRAMVAGTVGATGEEDD